MKNRTLLIALAVIVLLIVAAMALIQKDEGLPDTATSSPTPITSPTPSVLTLSSTAFSEDSVLPEKYTCDADNINPPLTFSGIPAGTKSLALTMHDIDIPKNLRPSGTFDHWVIFNIPTTTTGIAENSTVPGVQGNNSANKTGFMGSCPPPQYEPTEHRYVFTLYALDIELNLKQGATRAQVEAAAKDHTLASTTLIGTYDRAQ